MRQPTRTLNTKEKAVLGTLPKPKAGEPNGEYVAIADIAAEAFPKKGTTGKTKGNSWVRNSLRKLLKLKLVVQKGERSGFYARTSEPLPTSASKQRQAA